MSGLRFDNSSAFYFLSLVPILVAFVTYTQRRSMARLKAGLGDRVVSFLSSSVSDKKRRLKLWLEALAIVFFIVALSRPQMGESVQEVKSQGVEMMIAFDVSNSMLAEDVKPNRLEFAKKELERLLDLMPGNRVGIVAFAGSAALVSPITTDSSALKTFLESLSVDSVSTQGTNIEAALQVAKDAFERGGVQKDNVNRVTRVILLASDGEDHEEGALKEAATLAKDGTHIFALAFGTEKGAPIPERDPNGYLRGYKKDRSGNVIMTTTTGKELQEIAQQGNGSFYHAVFGGDYLRAIAEDIGKLEKAEFDTSVATSYDERYQLFLLLGIILALIEILIGERRGPFRIWKGRYEVPPA